MKIELMSWKNLARVVDHRFSLRTRVLYGTLGLLIAILLETGIGMGQQASTATAPIFNANAKYVQGVAPGYWPTTGAGLTLNLAAGSAYCGNPPALVTYPAGTLTMVDAATNLVYLDPAATCAPTVNQAANFAVGQIPIAKVVTAGSAITTITDMRGAGFAPLPCAMSSAGSVACSALGANQNITLTPSGTGGVVVPGASGDGKIYLQTGPPNSSFLSFLQGNYMDLSSNVLGCLNPNTSILFSCSTIAGQVNTVGASYTTFNPTVVGNAASGTNPGLVAMQGDANSEGAANVSSLIGVSGIANQDGSGAVTSMIAMYAQANSKTAGTVTNNYGLLVADQNAGVNNYTIYTQGIAPSHFNGGIDFVGKTCMAEAQPPSFTDGGKKISACIAALPPTGGTVDARGLQGASQIISSAIVFDRPVHLLLGATNFTYSGAAIAGGLIQFNAGSGGSWIEGNLPGNPGPQAPLPPTGSGSFPTSIQCVPSSGPMPIVVIASSVHGISLTGFALIGNANVSDDVQAVSTTDFLNIDHMQLLGQSGSFTTGYGVNFAASAANPEINSNSITNSLIQYTNKGVKNSSSGSVGLAVKRNLFYSIASSCIEIGDNGLGGDAATTIEGNVFQLCNQNVIGPTIAVNASQAWRVTGNDFEDNGGPNPQGGEDVLITTTQASTVTEGWSIDHNRFWKGGTSPNFAQTAIVVNPTHGFSGGSIHDNQCDSLIVGCIQVAYGSAAQLVMYSNVSLGTPLYVGTFGPATPTATPDFHVFDNQSPGPIAIFESQNSNRPSISLNNSSASGHRYDFQVQGSTGTNPGSLTIHDTTAAADRLIVSSTGQFIVPGALSVGALDAALSAGDINAARTSTSGQVVFGSGTNGILDYGVRNGGAFTFTRGSLNTPINTVTSSATPTFDASLGNTQKITLTANVTSSTLSNCAAGEFLVFDIIQDATGSHTFVWPSNVLNGGTIGSAASKHNIQSFYCDGTNARATSAILTNQN
ncbi:MAG: hypothetical protein ACYDA9_05295 [Terriglobia bacterium]